jgi:hypothetical protein
MLAMTAVNAMRGEVATDPSKRLTLPPRLAMLSR